MPDEKSVPETLETIAEKITALSTSTESRFADVDKRFDSVEKRFDDVDKRFDEVDKRFVEVSEAFVEQREYTEFAFERLRTEMNGGFSRLDRKLDRVLNILARTPPRRRRR